MVMRAYSIAKPAKRIWPLQLRKSINVTLFGYWRCVLSVAILLSVCSTGTVSTGQLRCSLGLMIMLGGNILAWAGVWQLSKKTTSGSIIDKKVILLQQKPTVFGWHHYWAAELSVSLWAILFCLVGIGTFILALFAEGTWLEELHGEAYCRYCRQVGQFLGRRAKPEVQTEYPGQFASCTWHYRHIVRRHHL